MIVSAVTDQQKLAMVEFLRARGADVMLSPDFRAIGRVGTSGKLIGVVAYTNFCGLTCFLHDAGEGNWLSRGYLKAIFEYPFVQLKLVQIFAVVAANNWKALKLNLHVGFKEFGRIKDGWEIGVDYLILTMTKADCRWIT